MNEEHPKPDDAPLSAPSDTTIGEQVTRDAEVLEELTELSVAKVQELARKEISAWQAVQEKNAPKLFEPKTWGTTNIGYVIAGALLSVIMGVAGWINWDKFDIFFTLEDEQRIRSLAKVEIEDARERPEFKASILEGITEISTNGFEGKNPFLGLISKRVKSMPLLTFHGQATFGDPISISIFDPYCDERKQNEINTSYSIEYSGLAAPTVSGQLGTPPSLQEQCETEIKLALRRALDIPFHARFFDKGASKERHSVFLVLFIERTRMADAMNRNSDAQPELAPAALIDQTASGQPAGLCIIYNPSKSMDAFKDGLLVEQWETSSDGYWIADLTEIVAKKKVWETVPKLKSATSYLHSILIDAVLAEERVRGAANSKGHPLCKSVDPVEKQSISVRAIILVNNDPYFDNSAE